MKSYWLLLLLALALAFFSGYEWFRASREEGAPRPEALEGLLGTFVRHHPAQRRLSLGSLLPLEQGDTLLDPGTLLPQLALFPLDELLSFSGAVANGSYGTPPGHPGLAKAWQWHRFLDRHEALAGGFFERPPYVHPAGGSYLRRAWESERAEFRDTRWIQHHLLWFHAGELARLAPEVLGPERQILAELDAEALEALHDRDGVVLSVHHLLVSRTRARPEQDTYDAYSRTAWEAFLLDQPVRLVPHRRGGSAVLRRGHLDWQLDTAKVRTRRLAAQKIEFAGILCLALGVLYLLVTGVGARLAEAHRRRFMLQTLTHELRTPLASATLSLERLRDGFDLLPGDAQTAFLRLCDDLARLDRVVQISRRYLVDTRDGRLLELNPVVVESPNEFLSDLVERTSGEKPDAVQFVGIESDTPATFDPYWVGVCVTNLVENALRHGRAPVVVRTTRHEDLFTLAVTDAGTCTFDRLEAMVKPFTRGPESPGSGLGLAIVQAVMTQMGGRLTFSPAPTCFTLHWSVR